VSERLAAPRPATGRATFEQTPAFHEYASALAEAKVDGTTKSERPGVWLPAREASPLCT
jgi:hypothetical protein